MAEQGVVDKVESNSDGLPEAVLRELEGLTDAERAAVIMLLLGESQAADIIRFMSPKEVQSVGSAMVGVVDLSQETVDAVLDDFVSTIKKQTNLGLGTTDYVEAVFKKALGNDKASTVLNRILPGSSSKGLEILRWMDPRAIADMIVNEHPQVVAIILSDLEYEAAADVINFLPGENRGCGQYVEPGNRVYMRRPRGRPLIAEFCGVNPNFSVQSGGNGLGLNPGWAWVIGADWQAI